MSYYNKRFLKKTTIGVWIDSKSKPEDGGGFGYLDQILRNLSHFESNDFELIFITNGNLNFPYVSNEKIYKLVEPIVIIKNNFLKRIVNKFCRVMYGKNLLNVTFNNEKAVKKELSKVIDIIYYPTVYCPIDYMPFILTVWDLGHLNTFTFPEVSMNGVFEFRDSYYKTLISKSLLILCESAIGRNELLKFYPVFEKKIKIVPMVPSNIINDEIIPQKPEELNQIKDFIFYPAQFWAHKNHYNLILGFKKALIVNPNLKLILCGADKGNLAYILELISFHDLRTKVLYLGFLEIEKLKWLYLNSKGLIMPTFLGPTNMPLLEAAFLGCNVACSDIPGHREQLGGYSYYFDPLDINEICDAILHLNKNQQKNQQKLSYNLYSSFEELKYCFIYSTMIRKTWGESDNIF